MDKAVENYIREKETKISNVNEKEKRKFLISQGLYKKVYLDIPEGVEPPEDVELEYDRLLDIYKFYRKEPLSVTDEEYKKMLELCKPKRTESSRNPISTALTVIAWIIYILGFAFGIVMGVISLDFSYCLNAFVYGTLILGFAEIIKLLQSIKNK